MPSLPACQLPRMACTPYPQFCGCLSVAPPGQISLSAKQTPTGSTLGIWKLPSCHLQRKFCLRRKTCMYLNHLPSAVIYLLECHIKMLAWIQVENKFCSICISHVISEMLSIIKIIYFTTPIDYIYYHKQICSCVCMLLLVHARVIKENHHIA